LPDEECQAKALSQVDQFLQSFYPQLVKLGAKNFGLKLHNRLENVGTCLQRHATTGSGREVDVLVPFDPHAIQTVVPGPGYVIVIIPSDAVPKTSTKHPLTEYCQDRSEVSEANVGGDPLEEEQHEEQISDRWRYGRSRDGTYLSPIVVSRTIHSLAEATLRFVGK